MKNKKFDYKEFQEFIKTPKGKAVLFFGIYAFFFLMIAILARSGGSTLDRKYESGSKYQFSIASIVNKNFNFDYEVNVDGNITNYSGSSDQSSLSFLVNNTSNYYYNGSNYFTNNISDILNEAMYVSKTEYDNGREVYNFKISSATLNKLFENKDLDIEEVPNEVNFSVNDEGIVDEITYNVDSYCKVKNICLNSMKVTLKYKDFGKIAKITSPLE